MALLTPATRGQVQTLERLNRSALAEMRTMRFELRPDALEGVRLPELLQHAVEALTGRGGVDVTTEIAPEPGPPTAQRVATYRIAQEALSNIGRHGGGRHVDDQECARRGHRIAAADQLEVRKKDGTDSSIRGG